MKYGSVRVKQNTLWLTIITLPFELTLSFELVIASGSLKNWKEKGDNMHHKHVLRRFTMASQKWLFTLQ